MFLANNLPKCDWPECNEFAITNVHGKWLCGNHTTKAIKNIQKTQEEIMFRE